MKIPETPFPFTIGNEIELQIVDRDGYILRGEELIGVWDDIFDSIENKFKKAMQDLPDNIKKNKTF